MVTIWISGQIVFQEEETVCRRVQRWVHAKELQGVHMTRAEFGKESDKPVKAER